MVQFASPVIDETNMNLEKIRKPVLRKENLCKLSKAS
jgi:hypothetical protein